MNFYFHADGMEGIPKTRSYYIENGTGSDQRTQGEREFFVFLFFPFEGYVAEPHMEWKAWNRVFISRFFPGLLIYTLGGV